MTITEAKSKAIASVLFEEPETWGKSEADKAGLFLANLFQKGELSPTDFAQATSEVVGNTSAMRQFLEKSGKIQIKATVNALSIAIDKELKALGDALDSTTKA